MRIIYPLLWSRPDRRACREQSIRTAAALARQGAEVTLMLPRGRDDPELTPQMLRDHFTVEGDFRVIQRRSRWGGEPLVWSMIWLRQVFADVEARAADLLLSRAPAMIWAGAASPLPFATDHYRLWPNVHPLAVPLARATSRHRNCLGLILHSHYAAEAYRRAGIADDRILTAHNGVEPGFIAEPMDKDSARLALELPRDRQLVVYAGRLNRAKGLDQLLALADLRPQTMFLLVGSEGNGPIEEMAARRDNVRTVPWQAPPTLATYLCAADVLLIPPSRAPLDRFGTCVLPLKTFTYLAAGRAIIAPDLPDTAEILTDGETALLVRPDEPGSAAAALDRLANDPALSARLAENGRNLSARLNWDSRAQKILAFLEERLAARSSIIAPYTEAPSRRSAGRSKAPPRRRAGPAGSPPGH